MASQQDIASTNECGINKLKENLKDANPTKNFCAHHTLSNSEKKATVVANYAEDLKKKFQKAIQYPRKARDHARDFNKTIVDYGGVRLFVKYENVAKLKLTDLKKSRRKFYPCETKTIVQRSLQIIYCSNMAPRKSQLIWIWQYWNLQLY